MFNLAVRGISGFPCVFFRPQTEACLDSQGSRFPFLPRKFKRVLYQESVWTNAFCLILVALNLSHCPAGWSQWHDWAAMPAGDMTWVETFPALELEGKKRPSDTSERPAVSNFRFSFSPGVGGRLLRGRGIGY